MRQDYAADVAAMRTDFADELADEGEGLTDEEVMRACWENDVREPYFELQYEEPVW